MTLMNYYYPFDMRTSGLSTPPKFFLFVTSVVQECCVKMEGYSSIELSGLFVGHTLIEASM